METWTRSCAIPATCPCSTVLEDGATGLWLPAVVSPDGRRMAATQGFGTWVWDLATGAELTYFTPRTGARKVPFYVTGLAFSPDGRFIINDLFDTRYDGNEPRVLSVGVHDSNTGGEFELLPEAGSDDFPYRVAFSPDGRSIALVTGTTDESGAAQFHLQRWAVS